MKDGYYTVEAVFVMLICISVVFSVFYGGFYVHDRMIISSVMNEMGDRQKEEKEIKTMLGKKLFLADIKSVKKKNGLASTEITVTYQLPIRARVLRGILQKGKAGISCTTEREVVKYTKYKWDYDILRGKGGA